ncbi:hypothetical protein DSUL_50347 [Desulfovibrionales bacterium]
MSILVGLGDIGDIVLGSIMMRQLQQFESHANVDRAIALLYSVDCVFSIYHDFF